MARIRVNDKCKSWARARISAGDVDRESSWRFTTEDGNKLLGPGNNWSAYSEVHLGIRVGEDRETKLAYAFPIGKNGKVYRAGVIAAKARAAQQGYSTVSAAADSLLKLIDKGMSADKIAESFHDDLRELGLAMASGHEFAMSGATSDQPGTELNMRWIQLVKFGENNPDDSRDPFYIDAADLIAMAEDYNGRSNIAALDWNHNTVRWFGGDDKSAAGWIQEVFPATPDTPSEAVPEDLVAHVEEYGPGLYGLVSFTKRGWEAVASKEYRYVSPVIEFDDDGHATRLYNAALTNTPALLGMKPVAASRGGIGNTSDGDTESQTETKEDEMLAKIMSALGVDQEDDIVGAIDSLKASAAKVAELQEALAAAKAEVAREHATKAVSEALEQGKIVKEQAEWATEFAFKDPEGFKAFLDATPIGTASREDGMPPLDVLTADGGNKPNGPELKLNLAGVSIVNNDPEKLQRALSRAKKNLEE